MKSNSFKGFLISVVICLITVLTYMFLIKKKDAFLLDNPTDKSINVVLNGEKYLLAPGQTVEIPVLVGKNTISAKKEDKAILLKDTFFILKDNRRGIINPTLSDYYTFKRYYGYIKNKDSFYNSHKVNIDGKEYLGEINKHQNLVLQGYSININQEYPKLNKKQDSITGITKLFRKNQFLNYYESISE